jgi:hypothetical protein
MATSIRIDRGHGARETKIADFPAEKLRLDPENVRFRHIKKVLPDRDMEKLIWDEPDTKMLLKAIIASGGLSSRPIITPDGVVKEGNRRTVCIRKIRELISKGELDHLSEETFKAVECEMLPADISQKEVDIYLARVHVSGVKEWDALNQAEHIWRMHQDRGMTFDEIRDLLGISKGKIVQKLRAFEWTVDFMKARPDKADIKKFSFFEELYKRPALRKWVDNDPTALPKFFNWVAAEKFNITGARDARILPEILENKDALRALDGPRGDMRQALALLQEGRPELSSPTFEAVSAAIKALKSIGREEYRSIPEKPPQVKMLKELYGELCGTFKELGIKP